MGFWLGIASANSSAPSGPIMSVQECHIAPRHNLTDFVPILVLLLISTESALGVATTSTHANLSLNQGKLMFLLQK